MTMQEQRYAREDTVPTVKLPVPIDVFLEEAEAIARVLEAHSAPTQGHLGLAAIDPGLDAKLAERVRALCATARASTRRALPPFPPGLLKDAANLARMLVRHARAARTATTTPDLHAAIGRLPAEAARIRSAQEVVRVLGALLPILRSDVGLGPTGAPLRDAAGRADAARIALVAALERRARARRENRADPSDRTRALAELETIVRRVRAAARSAFANHPELIRQTTSARQRDSKRNARKHAASRRRFGP